MKKILYTILIVKSCMFSIFSYDDLKIVGTFTSAFPYPYRFEILNEKDFKLEWTETGKKYRSWEKSRKYTYNLSEESIFIRIQLNEDVPNSLWFPIDGNPEPWNVGNDLLGLFGIDEVTGTIMGVTYSRKKDNYGLDVFTVDVPNYVFSGPPKLDPLTFSNPSSELREGSTIYELRNLYSVVSDETWVEGNTGNGIGESFKLTFNESPQYLAIINGYISASNPSLYWKNGRIKEFVIEGLTTGTTFKRLVLDTPHLQTIDIRELGNETIAKISISEVYQGSKYLDTCLHFMSYSEHKISPFEVLNNEK